MNLLDVVPGQAEKVVSDWVAEQGLPRYRATQIFPRLWQRPVEEWSACTDLPKDVTGILDRNFHITRPTLAELA